MSVLLKRLKIPVLSDCHLHLRQDEMLKAVIEYTLAYFGFFIPMPNIVPAILTGLDALRYREQILDHARGLPVNLLMTMQVTENTTVADIREAHRLGIRLCKIYPYGVTTNSENGVKSYFKLWPVLAEMERLGMVALFHGESPKEKVLGRNRERAFLTVARKIVAAFPRLRIVLEHITTRHAVKFVLKCGPNVAATITIHHLFITGDDVFGGRLDPKGSKLQVHNFCKPPAKDPEDLKWLIWAATSGDPKFFLGTDSAPHDKSKKEAACGCAGCFTAATAPELLVHKFVQVNAMDKLPGFGTFFGPQFYGVKPPKGTIELVRKDFQIPLDCKGVVPFKYGEVLPYSVAA
jgi:dihydroorotase